MKTTNRTRALFASVGIVIAVGVGTAVVVAAGDDADSPPIPVESDGGIGDTPIPVEPDGGIGDSPILVEPDGGIGDTPIPVEPDDGIGDTPIPVEPDGGIGDTPIPVEPDGGIGDTPDDRFSVEQARNDAHGLLGRYERDLADDVRVGRRGDEQYALTEDDVIGRLTVELDDEGDGYRVTSVVVELPESTETFHLTPS